ncbi:MAG: polymer-forming cytoskeletal protein [Acidobacteriota bacterium]|nr:polymer-forming cytoskeletal protein [Acidobacteriota bacterium]
MSLEHTLSDPPDQLNKRAFIGNSIVIKGDVSGDQDLVVHGRIEGTVSLPGYSITVGHDGLVKGDMIAKVIRIEGTVEGELQGEDKILLDRSAKVRGKITSPRVALEDGCRFSGGIHMTGVGERDAE